MGLHHATSLSFPGIGVICRKAYKVEIFRGKGLCDDSVDLPRGVNTFSSPKVVPYWLEQERDGYVDDVLRWARAYEPLYKRFQTLEQERTLGFPGSTILKMHSITTRIMLAGTFFDSEIRYDEILPEFKELYKLTESISSSPQRRTKYRITSTLLFSLLYFFFCLDAEIECPVIIPYVCCAPHFILKAPRRVLQLLEQGAGSCPLRRKGLELSIYPT